MKKAVIPILLFFIMLILPIIRFTEKEEKAVNTSAKVMSVEDTAQKHKKTNYFKVKRSKSGKIETVSEQDYVIGCVSAEIPVSYNAEAIKAQAVAAYTFACRKRENSNKSYDISDDFKTDQSYLSNNELKERWKENYDGNIKKIREAVEDVSGKRLIFDGKTALTVYHAVSPGKTNTAEEVWGSNIPYLISVDSTFDKLSPDYKKAFTFKKDEFLKTAGLESESEKLVTEKSKNGRVKYVKSGKAKISGGEITKMFNLPSGNFEIQNNKDEIIITVSGYGHGVGMSQYGANYMAENGSTYKEILSHYYAGCELS